MATKEINLHKRLAMGEKMVSGHQRGDKKVQGYARGGSVGSPIPAVSVAPSGRAANPLKAAKSMNGMPGLKRGGSVKK
jgi:hypothetical protein